jgi:hypothetical protein
VVAGLQSDFEKNANIDVGKFDNSLGIFASKKFFKFPKLSVYKGRVVLA